MPAEDIIHVDVLEPGFVGENPDDTVGFADRIVHPCLGAQTPYGAPNAGYGAPSPYGAPGGYQPNPYAPSGPVLATWGRRALGGLIDFVAPGIVVSMIIGLIFADRTSSVANLLSTVLTLGFWCYNTGYRLATTGYSFGHKIAQVRVVMADSGQTPTVNTAVLRAVCHLLDSWACMIGWLFPLWDAKKQTFADKITKTVSLDERNAGQR
ncbi:RDD family protein [Microbacterium lacticum]